MNKGKCTPSDRLRIARQNLELADKWFWLHMDNRQHGAAKRTTDRMSRLRVIVSQLEQEVAA
jgi:hypothetical protein